MNLFSSQNQVQELLLIPVRISVNKTRLRGFLLPALGLLFNFNTYKVGRVLWGRTMKGQEHQADVLGRLSSSGFSVR